MEDLSVMQFKERRPPRRRFRGQTLVEFALILPVMLLVVFVVVEMARVLHAWLAVENGARFGVRYAVTGEYDEGLYCAGYDGGVCDSLTEEETARIPSIVDAATVGAVAILRREGLTPWEPGFFKVTVCSGRDGTDGRGPFTFRFTDLANELPSRCLLEEIGVPEIDWVEAMDAGAPGNRVWVAVDFDHPLIVPFLSNWWPSIHLSARREGVVEKFRTARVIGLPATISIPTRTFTASATGTDTATATDTLTPTDTATPTDTHTPTYTPTSTPTPNCDDINIESFNVSGPRLLARVNNNNPDAIFLSGSSLSWTELDADQYVDRFRYNTTDYYWGNDYDSPTTTSPADPPSMLHPAGKKLDWTAYFGQVPGGLLWGDFFLTLTYNYSCSVQKFASLPEPTATFTPTITLTPSLTFTPTVTPTLPEPDCDDLSITRTRISGDNVEVRVRNRNAAPALLVDSTLWFTDLVPSMKFDYFRFQNNKYYNTDSDTSPVSSSAPSIPLYENENRTWEADFKSTIQGGEFDVELEFDFPNWGLSCTLNTSITKVPPTPTNTRTSTPIPTDTPTPTDGPSPTPQPTQTPSKTKKPSHTPKFEG